MWAISADAHTDRCRGPPPGGRKVVVQHLIQSFQRSSGTALVRTFRVNYKRHVLTMDDLSTLYGQNWLNDQVTPPPSLLRPSQGLSYRKSSHKQRFKAPRFYRHL